MSDVFLTPQEIYEKLTTAPGGESLGNAQASSFSEASREAARADRITRIGRTIQAGWQGSAADGAYGAAAPLADAALRGADDLYRAQDLLDRQSGSFQRAVNSVVPVSAGPPEMDLGDALAPVDHEKQVRAYQADAAHNMQVFEGYDNASVHNETHAPREYPIISHSGGNIAVTSAASAGEGDPSSGGRTGDGGASGGYRGGGAPSGGVLPGGGPLPGGSGQTRPNDYVPPPAGYQPPRGTGGGSGGGSQTGGPGGGGFVGGGGAGGGRGGAGAGGGRGGGFGSGAGGSGGGRGSGVGGGGGASGGGPRVPGGGAGVAVPGESGRGGVAGVAGGRTAGSAGAMGAAPMGGGRGKGDDDSEHDRKYLIEPDPEEMFGSEVLTAPQVIGDDEYEDD